MANETIKQITCGGVTRDIEDAAARQTAAAAYQKPADGIPATDLAPAVQTSLGKADTALQAADKTQLQGAINSLQNALNNLIGGNVQGAIDTFNEVVAFLNGIDTSDPTLKNQLLALNTAITNLGNSLAAVATSGSYNDLTHKPTIPDTSSLATKSELQQGLAGKQDTLTFDNAPTAGSNNPVKSGGIKTALDNLLANLRIVNGEWYIGNTATGVSAQGPAGNVSITDASQLVTILVNDLTTGGAGNILSAEMGKVLKIAVQTLIDSMGDYCFPNGRPTLAWEGPKCNVAQSLTDVTSDFSATRVDKNGSLEITLSPVDNLHVFLTGDVTVEMPLGTDITSTAWNENTGKVTIADVTDDVVITAKSSTYVSRGLVMHLDGKNRGGTAGKWKSLVDYNNSPLYFKLENCDEQSNYVAGNGTNSKGTAFSDSALTTPVTLLDVGAADGTIEAAYSNAEINSAGIMHIMHNGLGGGNRICLSSWHPSSFAETANAFVMCTSPGLGRVGISKDYFKSDINSGGYVSFEKGSFMFNGNTVTSDGDGFSTANEESKLSLFYRRTSSDQFGKLRLYALRVYSVQLTDAERALNLAIDQKRFNLS